MTEPTTSIHQADSHVQDIPDNEFDFINEDDNTNEHAQVIPDPNKIILNNNDIPIASDSGDKQEPKRLIEQKKLVTPLPVNDDIFEFAAEEEHSEEKIKIQTEKLNEVSDQVEHVQDNQSNHYSMSNAEQQVEISDSRKEDICICTHSIEQNEDKREDDVFEFAPEEEPQPIEHEEEDKIEEEMPELPGEEQEQQIKQSESKPEDKLECAAVIDSGTEQQPQSQVHVEKQDQHNEDVFDFVAEDEPSESQQNKLTENVGGVPIQQDQTPEIEKIGKKEEPKEDDFDFVAEDEPSHVEKTDAKKEKKKEDDFEFVNEEEANSKEAEVHGKIEKDQVPLKVNVSIGLPSSIRPAEGRKNEEQIKTLLSEYKSKYCTLTNSFQFIESNLKERDDKLRVSNAIISDYQLNCEKESISLGKVLAQVSNFQTPPEIAVRVLAIDELGGHQSNSSSRPELSNLLKVSEFHKSLTEIKPSVIKNLYFKFIELKNIYVNSILTQGSKIIDQSTQPDKTTNDGTLPRTTIPSSSLEVHSTLTETTPVKKNGMFEYPENENEDFKPNEANSDNNSNTNKMINDVLMNDRPQMIKPKSLAKVIDDEEDVIDEFEEKNEKQATTIEINKDLYAIVDNIPTSSSNDKKSKQDDKHEQETVFDEGKMLEMLKKISSQEDNVTGGRRKEKSEEEKNNEELNEIISNLPNYNFMVSKYLESPDSLLNIN